MGGLSNGPIPDPHAHPDHQTIVVMTLCSISGRRFGDLEKTSLARTQLHNRANQIVVLDTPLPPIDCCRRLAYISNQDVSTPDFWGRYAGSGRHSRGLDQSCHWLNSVRCAFT